MSTFSLNSTMGSSWRVNEDDVVNTKTALRDLGYYQPPSHGINDWTEDAMFDGIKAFQKDYGLKVDGVMKPGGPTEGKINDVILAAGKRTQNVKRPSDLSPNEQGPNGRPRLGVPPPGTRADPGEAPGTRVGRDGTVYICEPSIFSPGGCTYKPLPNRRNSPWGR